MPVGSSVGVRDELVKEDTACNRKNLVIFIILVFPFSFSLSCSLTNNLE